MNRDTKEIEVKRADDWTVEGDRTSGEGCNIGNKKGGVIIESLQLSDRITD